MRTSEIIEAKVIDIHEDDDLTQVTLEKGDQQFFLYVERNMIEQRGPVDDSLLETAQAYLDSVGGSGLWLTPEYSAPYKALRDAVERATPEER